MEGRSVGGIVQGFISRSRNRSRATLSGTERQRYLKLLHDELKPFIARCQQAFERQELITKHLESSEPELVKHLRTTRDGERLRTLWQTTHACEQTTIRAWERSNLLNDVATLEQRVVSDRLSEGDKDAIAARILYLRRFWLSCLKRDGLFEQLHQMAPDHLLLVNRLNQRHVIDPQRRFTALDEWVYGDPEPYEYPPSFYSEFKSLHRLNLSGTEFESITTRLKQRWQHLDLSNYEGVIADYHRRKLGHRPEPPRTLDGTWLYDWHHDRFPAEPSLPVAHTYTHLERESLHRRQERASYAKAFRSRVRAFKQLDAAPFAFPQSLADAYHLWQRSRGATTWSMTTSFKPRRFPAQDVIPKFQLPTLNREEEFRASRFPAVHSASGGSSGEQSKYHFRAGTSWYGASYDGPFTAKLLLKIDTAQNGSFEGKLTLEKIGREKLQPYGLVRLVQGTEDGDFITMECPKENVVGDQLPSTGRPDLPRITMEGTFKGDRWDGKWKMPELPYREGHIHLTFSILDQPPSLFGDGSQ